MSDDKRPIRPGSCTWCGHEPHTTTCTRSIRTKNTETQPCPCRRHHQ